MHVYAVISGSVPYQGGTVRLVKGEVWDRDDPMVKDRPELFAEAPSVVRNTTGRKVNRDEKPVERATRAPGEKRKSVR